MVEGKDESILRWHSVVLLPCWIYDRGMPHVDPSCRLAAGELPDCS